MKQKKDKQNSYEVTIDQTGKPHCKKICCAVLDIYVMAFSEETPTTIRFLLNAFDEKEAIEKGQEYAKDVFSRRDKSFPYLGKSYKSLEVFKKTPIQLCPDYFKTVYEYEWEDMIHPKDAEKVYKNFAYSIFDETCSVNCLQKEHAASKAKNLLSIREILFSDEYVLRSKEHILKFVSNCKTEKWVIENMKELQTNSTTAENSVLMFLAYRKVPFVFQAPFCFGKNTYFADFYLPEKKIIVEIDGLYHSKRKQEHKDELRDIDFCRHGIDTIRIKNEVAMNNENLQKVLSESNII